MRDVVWSCSYIIPFWEEVGQLMAETLDIIFDFSSTFLYLGKIPEGLSKMDTYLLNIFMVAGKKSNYQMLAPEESSHYETLYKHYEFYPWYGEDDLYAAASKGERR